MTIVCATCVLEIIAGKSVQKTVFPVIGKQCNCLLFFSFFRCLIEVESSSMIAWKDSC